MQATLNTPSARATADLLRHVLANLQREALHAAAARMQRAKPADRAAFVARPLPIVADPLPADAAPRVRIAPLIAYARQLDDAQLTALADACEGATDLTDARGCVNLPTVRRWFDGIEAAGLAQ